MTKYTASGYFAKGTMLGAKIKLKFFYHHSMLIDSNPRSLTYMARGQD